MLLDIFQFVSGNSPAGSTICSP